MVRGRATASRSPRSCRARCAGKSCATARWSPCSPIQEAGAPSQSVRSRVRAAVRRAMPNALIAIATGEIADGDAAATTVAHSSTTPSRRSRARRWSWCSRRRAGRRARSASTSGPPRRCRPNACCASSKRGTWRRRDQSRAHADRVEHRAQAAARRCAERPAVSRRDRRGPRCDTPAPRYRQGQHRPLARSRYPHRSSVGVARARAADDRQPARDRRPRQRERHAHSRSLAAGRARAPRSRSASRSTSAA